MRPDGRLGRRFHASLVIAIGAASAAKGGIVYTITEVGLLPGGGFNHGQDINSAGAVAGDSDSDEGKHGFLSHGDAVEDLGLPDLPFVLTSEAAGVNDTGSVVLNATNGAPHAYIWHSGEYTDIQDLPGALYSEGARINDAGHVVGDFVFDAGGGLFPHHAFFYDGASMIDLFPSLGYSDAHDINDADVVVGDARFGPGSTIHGFRWESGAATDLGPVPGITSTAHAINQAGVIAGAVYFDGSHAAPVLWVDGEIVELPLPETAVSASAFDVNEAGTVIGRYTRANGVKRLFVHASGESRDLQDLLVQDGEWYLTDVEAINGDGLIVGSALKGMLTRAVILTPIEECTADVSGDGTVGSVDLNIVLAAFGCAGGAGCEGDADGDGDVDSADLNAVLGTFGEPCGG